MVCGAAVLLGIGSALLWWNRLKTDAVRQDRPIYQGASAHWDQSEVPVSLQCAACHPEEFRQWSNSDHAWAFRKLDPQLDAEAFHGNKLKAHGSTLVFSTGKDGERSVLDEKSGKTWKVAWATGRTPLVQYLLPASDEGYHTMSAAWDVNHKEWFDIFGKEERSSNDWGHWLGRGMNWNSQCAWCHMSDFRKNYDPAADRYHSTWKEPGVSCIQCHGPLLNKPEDKTGCMISTVRKPTLEENHDNCAACHARRDEFDHEFSIGKKFDDHFQLVLPVQPGVFWPNGMQRDEDYCETGLRLSRMGKAGVTCLDCHDPHSGLLKLPQENNALCMRCHATGEKVNGVAAPVIDMAKHTPCPPDSMGGRCVECHMPESPYMARDPRRDHSFNSPDPAMSLELKIPNACTMCHKDKDDQWAARVVEQYYGKTPKMARYRDRTRAVQWAYDGDSRALDALLKAYGREENDTWKATLMELLDSWSDEQRVQSYALQGMKSPTPLLRAAAAKVLGRTDPQALKPLLQDSSRVVRLQAEWALRDELPQESAGFLELGRAAMHQADQPSGAMKLAQLEAGRGNDEAAREWFEKALRWDATSPVVRRDYAVYLSGKGKINEAVALMTDAVKLSPQDASLWYLLGLGQVEIGQNQQALTSFEKAVEIDEFFSRARYNMALLYNSLGNHEIAIRELKKCMKFEPENADYPYAIATIYSQIGNKEKSKKYAEQSLKINSNHHGSWRILERSSRQ